MPQHTQQNMLANSPSFLQASMFSPPRSSFRIRLKGF
jgi:hypothetical protein